MKDNLVSAVLLVSLLVLSACGAWAENRHFGANAKNLDVTLRSFVPQDDGIKDSSSTSLDITSDTGPLEWTQSLYNWALEHTRLSGMNPGKCNSQTAQVVPEARTLYGFGAALVLNGLGVAGTGYYLRRRYNRASAMRYANRHAVRLPMFIDIAVSIVVLLVVSPLLCAVAAAGALRSGSPKVYGRTGQASPVSNNKELLARE